MAAISSPTPTVTPSTTPVTPSGSTGTSSSSSSGQPLYLGSFSSQSIASSLGLSTPRSLGDLEALFAEISSELGETQNQAAGFTRAANTSARSTSLIAAARNLLQMVGVALNIETEDKEIAKQQAIITAKKDELQGLKDQRSGLVSTRDAAQDSKSDKVGERDGHNLDLIGLYILALAAPDDQALKDEIAYKEGRVGTLNGEIDALTSQINELNGQITALDFDIAGVEIELFFAGEAKDAATEALEAAIALLALLFVALLPFSIFLAMEAKKDAGQDSFAVSSDNLDLDQVLKDAIDRIAGRDIDQTERNLVRENLEQDLPAGSGNPNAVVDRAVGFAGSISALQGALKQVLFGETSSTADATDVSGRLRFTV